MTDIEKLKNEIIDSLSDLFDAIHNLDSVHALNPDSELVEIMNRVSPDNIDIDYLFEEAIKNDV